MGEKDHPEQYSVRLIYHMTYNMPGNIADAPKSVVIFGIT